MFCDFCPCLDCQIGGHGLYHAKTSDDLWICDVCYDYDECIKVFKSLGIRRGPCENECSHRPKIIGEWSEQFRVN